MLLSIHILTHFFGKQVNILFVTSLRSVVQLYEGQSLEKKHIYDMILL